MALDLPLKILIGPLSDPEWLGDYLHSENLKIFGPVDQAYPPDISYVFPNAHFNNILEQLPSGWEPDVIVWLDVYRHHSLVPGIESVPFPSALVIGDWNIQSFNTLQYAQAFDYVFSDSTFVSLLGQNGYSQAAFFSTISFTPELQHLPVITDKRYDIAFVGTEDPYLRPERGPYVKRLARMGSEYRIFVGQANFADYIDILRHSKIVFNHSWSHNLNPRVYEAAACGALLFMESQNHDIETILPPGCCVRYDDNNLEALLRYYLENDSEREQIARAGYRRIQFWNYHQQFEWLLKQLPKAIAVYHQGKSRRFNSGSDFVQKGIYRHQWLSSLTPGAVDAATLLVNALAEASLTVAGQLLLAIHRIECAYRLPASSPEFMGLLQSSRDILITLAKVWPKPALLLHHLAWVAHLMGQENQSLAYYQSALTVLQSQSQPLELPLSLDDAILSPFGKLHTGPHACFFYRWQRLSAQLAHDPIQLNQERQALLGWQICKSIGEYWEKRWEQLQDNPQKSELALHSAQQAYQQAIEFCPTLTDPYYRLGILALRQNNPLAVLNYFGQALAQQPVLFNVFEILAVIVVHAFPLEPLDHLLNQCLEILQVYPLRQDLAQRLQARQNLVRIGLQGFQSLPTEFNVDFFDGLAPLLAVLGKHAPILTESLTGCWFSLIPERPPLGLGMGGYNGSWQIGESAWHLKFPDLPVPLKITRLFDRQAIPGELAVSPEQWPFQFEWSAVEPLELEGKQPFQFLWLCQPDDGVKLVEDIVAFAQAFRFCKEIGLWLWNPLGGADESAWSEWATLLDPNIELELTCLTDIPAEGTIHAAILHQSQVVRLAPTGVFNYYLWWALAMGLVVCPTSSVYCPYPSPVANLVAGAVVPYEVAEAVDVYQNYSQYLGPAQEIQSQLALFYSGQADSIWLNALWQLRLNVFFNSNPELRYNGSYSYPGPDKSPL